MGNENSSEKSSRGPRRARTIAVGERRREVHLRQIHPDGVVDCACELSAWRFAKRGSVSCRCRRRSRREGPKVWSSLCHDNARGYHPSVAERIDGKRLAARWCVELRGAEPDDVEL